MKGPRIFAALLAATALAAAAYAQDAGIDSNTSLSFAQTDSGAISVGETVTPWFVLPMGSVGSFSGEAHAGLSYDAALSPFSGVFTFPLDLDSLELAFSFKKPSAELSSFELSIGRLAFEDPSALVLSHPADGIALGFTYPALALDFRAGYTGLVLKNSSSLVLSLADLRRLDSATWLGSPRLLGLASLRLTRLQGHELALSLAMQKDLNPAAGLIAEGSPVLVPGRGGSVDTEYAVLAGKGPIIPKLSYEAWFSMGAGRTLGAPTAASAYRYVPILSAMGGGSLSYAIPEFLDSVANLRVLAASGDPAASRAIEGAGADQARATAFIPLATLSSGAVFMPSLSNLVLAEAGYTVKPLAAQDLSAGLKALVFFRPTTGPVEAAGLLPSSTSPYLGTEIDLRAEYGVLTDLVVSFIGGLFFPGRDPAGAFDPAFPGSSLEASAGLDVTIKL